MIVERVILLITFVLWSRVFTLMYYQLYLRASPHHFDVHSRFGNLCRQAWHCLRYSRPGCTKLFIQASDWLAVEFLAWVYASLLASTVSCFMSQVDYVLSHWQTYVTSVIFVIDRILRNGEPNQVLNSSEFLFRLCMYFCRVFESTLVMVLVEWHCSKQATVTTICCPVKRV